MQQILLMNLGTPDDCQPSAVKRYLKQFLNDPRVIDLPAFIRWPLVNLFILPFRYKKSAAAYQQIWQANGSPLLVNSQHLQTALAQALGPDYQVELGMRYGSPSIPQALKKFDSLESLTVIPLFPQYASAATGSAVEKLLQSVASLWNIPSLRILSPFYAHPEFINACADKIKKYMGETNPDLLLLSYHGLPERHIHKSDCQALCDRKTACPQMEASNRYCYRAQCYATSELIAHSLGLTSTQYHVSFQSRLGRTPWIKPYTDLLLPELVKKGVKHLAVACPSFVADCLETLEEVDMRIRQQWLECGGEKFTFIPCLNDSPLWVEALVNMIKQK